ACRALCWSRPGWVRGPDGLRGRLRKGSRRRGGRGDGRLPRPPILVLDEPTAGLDPNQIREVRSLVCELGREHAVLLSTHILPEVEATCDRALVISRGTLVAEGTIDALRKRRRASGGRIAISGEGDVRKVLAENPAIEQITEEEDGKYTVMWLAEVDDIEAASERVAGALVAAGFGLRELSPVKPSLEQVFAELTEGAT